MSERGGGGDNPPVVSNHEIAEALHNILRETNPNLFNLNVVVHQLQSRLGIDLSPKLDFIRFQINHFFSQTLFEAGDNIALEQNRGYYFPWNFSLQGHEPPSRELPPPAQPVLPAHKTPKPGAQPEKKRKGGPGGLTKLCGVSPELQTIVGQPTMPRTEIVKQLWAYIKKHNLQDPNNKRKINCNDELRLLFETDCTDMFKMNKLLSKHILTLDSAQTSKKTKVDTESGSESADTVPIVIISEALANFFGTAEREMPQPEVLKKMWEYVKVNKLEDPANAMAIHCDEKLKELFGCESISALGIPEMLSRRHLTNKS
ncbi:chromatin/chromatin-binding, or -regulatory protein [Lithospermum erythrorhizon]|uniref:Chromatin/chromatin-binding, or -regulatory protein n=1 Tax=Lithospermum erythrorhizon TaxID=34254 RepID=A0AAV3NJU2_LITER